MEAGELSAYGIDSVKGLKNCMDSESFYRQILSMFLDDGCCAAVEAAYAAGDCGKLFAKLHELKGISGNAALTALYQATLPAVELVRGQDAVPDGARALLDAVQAAYARTCEGIRRYLGC